jgi:hypothetical protein
MIVNNLSCFLRWAVEVAPHAPTESDHIIQFHCNTNPRYQPQLIELVKIPVGLQASSSNEEDSNTEYVEPGISSWSSTTSGSEAQEDYQDRREFGESYRLRQLINKRYRSIVALRFCGSYTGVIRKYLWNLCYSILHFARETKSGF